MVPRFSVLLPTRNRPELLRFAIESALAQSESALELLVVGDGCEQATAAMVTGFDDPRVRWFDLPKAPGFGYANRNVALREARGDYIAFLADDDLLFPDHLAVLASTLESTGAEWAYSRPLWVTSRGLVVPFAINLSNPAELDTFITVANHIPMSCVMFRRTCLSTYGYWPEDVLRAADWHYWIRIIEGGGRSNLAYSPIPTTLHFNADWKTGPEHEAGQVASAARVASSWWPEALSVTIPRGVPEQHVFLDLLADATRLDRLRHDAARAVDHLAWRALDEFEPLAHARAADASALGDTRAHLDAVLTSRTWRITRPLRSLKRRFRSR